MEATCRTFIINLDVSQCQNDLCMVTAKSQNGGSTETPKEKGRWEEVGSNKAKAFSIHPEP